ncbi:MAG: glycosyltransferase, partial [Myxococcota bacterium]
MSEMRILHVFGRMGRGGAETWLMNVLRRIDRDRFRFDFLVHRTRAGEFDDEIRALGSDIHIIPGHKNLPVYTMALRALLARRPYHAIHSHVSFFSGYILSAARALGVKSRIAHCHTSLPTTGDSLPRTLYKRASRQAIHASATRGLGCSSRACQSLYGANWRARDKYQVLLYGYD